VTQTCFLSIGIRGMCHHCCWRPSTRPEYLELTAALTKATASQCDEVMMSIARVALWVPSST